jgi:hypothetical protein
MFPSFAWDDHVGIPSDGEFIEQDRVAVRVSPDHRPAIAGSPAYFESHPTPKSPRDLLNHRYINFRRGDGGARMG